MKCIVGLGNPGRKYANTRHNVGYMVLREIAGRLGVSMREHGFSEIGRGALLGPGGDETPVLLVKPLTYMNRSGQAVLEVAQDFHVQPSDILVIYDDMDLPFGKIRLRRKGSSAGHKGIESIAAFLETTEFPRLKVGIGRPPEGVDPVEFVLKPYEKADEAALAGVVSLAASAASDAITKGIDWAMGEYNGQSGLLEHGEEK
ncbi:MAG: aminoacyl-tRNA hydrolase [Bacillota bacterium]